MTRGILGGKIGPTVAEAAVTAAANELENPRSFIAAISIFPSPPTSARAAPDIPEKIRLAKIFKALSNPNRLELYLEIAKTYETSFSTDGECFISDICNSLKIGAPTISHHLKELANADLITTERRGKFLVARLNEATIKAANKILSIQKKQEV